MYEIGDISECVIECAKVIFKIICDFIYMFDGARDQSRIECGFDGVVPILSAFFDITKERMNLLKNGLIFGVADVIEFIV